MTRKEILEAAAQIISQRGFHATSMQDIADAVNLQKASLYHHISSKQELLVTLLDQAVDLLIANMESVLSEDNPADVKLQKAIRVYLSTLLEHRDLAAVLLLEYRSLKPELRVRHTPRRDHFEKLWRNLLREGIASGIFCCPDPALTTRALLGVMNWTITWYRSDGFLTAENIAEDFSMLFLKGLLRRPCES